MKVPYVDIAAQYMHEREEILEAVDRVLSSGQHILNEDVTEFEREFAELCAAPYAISVANGTDALVIALKALGIGTGDEVITVANSFIASVSCIALAGATPVFADINDTLNMCPRSFENAITPKTKAVIPVHLSGNCAEMDEINCIAKQHGLYVLEDAAQAVGSLYDGRPTGSLGDIGCFSLHPLKNLNAAGDAGIITCHNKELAERIKTLRQHGLVDRNTCAEWGYNSRLDSIQAAVLRVRIRKLDRIIEQRRHNAALYTELLGDCVSYPRETEKTKHSYHVFMIETDRRDELQSYLLDKGIATAIHYPVPAHLQPCAKYLNYTEGALPLTENTVQRILSLPIHQSLNDNQISSVSAEIKAFLS